jgi:hypothetical protein
MNSMRSKGYLQMPATLQQVSNMPYAIMLTRHKEEHAVRYSLCPLGIKLYKGSADVCEITSAAGNAAKRQSQPLPWRTCHVHSTARITASPLPFDTSQVSVSLQQLPWLCFSHRGYLSLQCECCVEAFPHLQCCVSDS